MTNRSLCRSALNKRNATILKALYYFNKNQRKIILKSVDRAIVKLICECILNIINGNIKISGSNKTNLGKHKKVLRKLVDPQKKINWRKRREILVQKGSGILSYIIGPVMSILLDKLLEKK